MRCKTIDEEVKVYKECLEEEKASRLRLFLNDRYMQALREYYLEEKIEHILFTPRQIGSNWLPCFICPTDSDGLKDDFASFVKSRADGEKAVEWFRSYGLITTLDYRPSEPDWVQVKTAACDQHKYHLRYLRSMIQTNGNVLSKGMLGEF